MTAADADLHGSFRGFGPQALPFLTALGFHQSREWFQDNRALYESDLRQPLDHLIGTLANRFGATGLPFRGSYKASAFRINRDVRFSKDKRPYQTHVSAVLTPSGTKKDMGVLFYLQFGTDGCFASLGIWQPEPERLKAIRQAIAGKPDRFRAMQTALAAGGLAFSEPNALKRSPTGFDHVSEPDLASAIRQRNFVVNRDIPEARWRTPALVDDLVDFAEAGRPLLDWTGKLGLWSTTPSAP